jgi:hypothetical protein
LYKVTEIIKAALAGMLANIVRRLGPSIILFAYVWALHSKRFAALGDSLLGLPANFWLAMGAIILGIGALAFKDKMTNLSRALDRRALPPLQAWVLRYVNRYDLSFMNTQRNALNILTGLKSLAVFLCLVTVALLSFPVFAAVLLGVLSAVVALSLNAAKFPAYPVAKSFFARLRTHPEYYAEVLVIAGLILAFMAIASKNSFVSGTVFILIVSRFSNEIKVIARSFVAVRRSQLQFHRIWENRQLADQRRQARLAEAEARRQERMERQAAAAARRAAWQANVAARKAQAAARQIAIASPKVGSEAGIQSEIERPTRPAA